MDLQNPTEANDSVSFAGEQRDPLRLGYDPGQSPDPAALCVTRVERRPVPGKWDPKRYVPEHTTSVGFHVPEHYGAPVEETHYLVHFMQVLHGMPYPDQVEYLATLLREPRFRNRQVKVRVDVTGVGQHPAEALARELQLHSQTRHIQVVPVRFVAGENYTYNKHPETLGKGALVAILLQRLQWRLVHVSPDMMDVAALQSELEVFHREMSEESGTTTYGAQAGFHDDRIIALGLSILEDVYANRVTIGPRIY